MPFFIVVILFILAIVLLCITVRVVTGASALIIERFGSYHATWRPGLQFLIPLIDRV